MRCPECDNDNGPLWNGMCGGCQAIRAMFLERQCRERREAYKRLKAKSRPIVSMAAERRRRMMQEGEDVAKQNSR